MKPFFFVKIDTVGFMFSVSCVGNIVMFDEGIANRNMD